MWDTAVSKIAGISFCSSLIWALTFHYLSYSGPSFACAAFNVIACTIPFIKSEKIALNILIAASCITIFSMSYSLGACRTLFKVVPGLMLVWSSLLLKDVQNAVYWFCVVLVMNMVLNLEFLCQDVYQITKYHLIAFDLTYAFAHLGFLVIYERSLAASNEARSKFVAGVLHELRTPLNGIVCAAELLLESETLSEEDVQDAGTIFGCGQLMSSLINNVLDSEMMVHMNKRYEGIEDDMIFNVHETCLKACNGFKYIAQFKDVHCTFHGIDAMAETITVKGDARKFLQVLSNVLSNALKCSPEKSVVGLSIIDAESHVVIAIEDQGPGVPRSLRDKIFQSWVKLTSANTPGVGLGLTIAQVAMREMGGDIVCTSRVDMAQGARFELILPKYMNEEQNIAGPTKMSETKRSDDVYAVKKVNLKLTTRSGILSDLIIALREGISPRKVGDRDGGLFISTATHVRTFLSTCVALKNRLLASAVAARMAMEHGQELETGCAIVLSVLAIIWVILCHWLELGTFNILFPCLCTAGYLSSLILPNQKARAISVCAWFFAMCFGVSTFGGLCQLTGRSIQLAISLTASLLVSDSRVTFATWLITTLANTYILYNYTECEVAFSPAANYLYNVTLDSSYFIMLLSLTSAYVFQWRVCDRIREKFLNNMSQELRTPLFAIVCAAEVMQERSTGSETDLDNVATISSCGKLLASLLNHCLDFVQLKAASKMPEQEQQELRNFSPNKLCTQMLTIMEHVTSRKSLKHKKNIKFLFDSQVSDACLLPGEQSKISQILLNMLDNAVKVSPPHSTITIRVEYTENEQMVKFNVKDEGPGVTDAMRDKIFQPWVKMTDSNVSGAGLGLAISMAIVEGLGGRIGCGKRGDGRRGARFWFTVPVQPMGEKEEVGRNDTVGGDSGSPLVRSTKGALQGERSTARVGKRISSSNVSRSMSTEDVELSRWYRDQHILIVDDNTVNLKMLRSLLLAELRRGEGKKKTRKERERFEKKEGKCDQNFTYSLKEIIKIKNVECTVEKTDTGKEKSKKETSKRKKARSVQHDGESDPAITSCLNGREAVNHVKEFEGNVDVIFMDLNMPVMNGNDAAEEILAMCKANKRKKPFIIALTANVRNSVEKTHFDAVLTKPLSRERLREMLLWIYRKVEERDKENHFL